MSDFDGKKVAFRLYRPDANRTRWQRFCGTGVKEVIHTGRVMGTKQEQGYGYVWHTICVVKDDADGRIWSFDEGQLIVIDE